MPQPDNHTVTRIRLLVLIVTLTWFVLLLLSTLFSSNKNIPLLTQPPLSSKTNIGSKTNASSSTSTSVETGTATYTVHLPIVMTPSATGSTPTGPVYYVSTSGSDSNPGTATRPFRSVEKGVSVLRAGDTLYVRSGTYLLSSPLAIYTSGTASKPITIRTAPGEPYLAILSGDLNGNKIADPRGAGDGSYWFFVQLGGSYIRFQNFEVAFSAGQGIRSDGGYNVISGNLVHNTQSSGIWVHGPYNIVENNTLWRTVESNNCAPSDDPYGSGSGVSRQCDGNWPGALAWGDTSGSGNPAPNTIIRHNLVFHNSGEGMLCMNTNGATVEDNILYDNWALGIDLDQCSSTILQRNLVYYSADKTWWRGSTNPAHAIMLSNEGILAGYPIGSDRKVINNIIIGSNIRYWGRATGSALKNDLIANNTIVESQGMAPLIIDAPTDPGVHTNTRIANNLILQSSGALATVGTLAGLTFDHNLWSRNASIIPGSGDVIGNPLLAAPTTPPCTLQITHPDSAHPLYEYHLLTCGSPNGVRLTSASPGINTGANLSSLGVTVDFWGAARDTRPDLGANELIQ